MCNRVDISQDNNQRIIHARVRAGGQAEISNVQKSPADAVQIERL